MGDVKKLMDCLEVLAAEELTESVNILSEKVIMYMISSILIVFQITLSVT